MDQQTTIKAMMQPRIDKYDDAGNLVETVELPAREVEFSLGDWQALQAQAQGGL